MSGRRQPLGLADGLGSIAPIDNGARPCQTIHRRPIVSGFVARLPPRLLATHRSDPLPAAWLQLSGAPGSKGAALPDPQLSAERLHAEDIAFVTLNSERASAALREHVERGLPLTLIAEDESRVPYFSISPVRMR